MALTLGIDVAVRAAHQATLARDGATVGRGRKLWTSPEDLEKLWADVDGTPITEAGGRAIVKERYQLEPRHRDNVRHKRMRERRKQAAGRESQESPSAPTSQPANTQTTIGQAA